MSTQVKIVLSLLVFVCGCAPEYNISQKVIEIEKKHNVTIDVESTSNQNGVCKLLDIIDEDLEGSPRHFIDNLGPIIIEDSFDEVGSGGSLMLGYVDEADYWNRFPIHIKNRSPLGKILSFTPRANDVFLHEASHSYEFNIKSEISGEWEKFYEEFESVQVREYNTGALYVRALLPVAPRPAAMPSLYGSINHNEDFAETHCYLRRNDIEQIKETDPILYKKCKIVERFVNPEKIGALNNVAANIKTQ
ncbi:MAG: hypothetical protein KAS23_11905 [Anaerohalosphaera sp.]|nr:hypothetical protein [Anaerohalosphaera sp.]